MEKMVNVPFKFIKKYLRCIKKSKEILDSVQVPYSDNVCYSLIFKDMFSYRSNGLCQILYVQDEDFCIRLSRHMFEKGRDGNDIEDWILINTIIHELIHTVKGCHGTHDAKWKSYAERVNEKYKWLNIQKTNHFPNLYTDHEDDLD